MGVFTDHEEQDLSAVPPLRSEDVMTVLIGRMKGIQGHCNSCYMDSALFRFGPAFKVRTLCKVSIYTKMFPLNLFKKNSAV